MNVGMLWFDANRGTAVAERVERAADYYKEKYGAEATLCFVHPDTLAEPSRVGSLEVKPLETVLANHFWLGVKPLPEDEN